MRINPLLLLRQARKMSMVIKLGGSDVIYSPDKPLSCGARVWIETYNPVIVTRDEFGDFRKIQ